MLPLIMVSAVSLAEARNSTVQRSAAARFDAGH
jgi:hypothetical protein